MDECETELRFRASGKVEGITQIATDSISVLGLDTKAIREERRQRLDNLMFYEPMISWGITDINELQLLVDVYDIQPLHEALKELQQPDDNGQLLEYSPVLINILKQFLNHKTK
ncbi:MAG: hypothetical protein Q8N30_10075 [Methylococcales bacterium]|nr:hypothetical protein [Methylococcales bacterium]